VPSENEDKALKRLHRELTQYQGDSDFASNPNGFLKDFNRNRDDNNYSYPIQEGCKCQRCSDMRYRKAHRFNRRLDLIRSQSNIIARHDNKRDSSEMANLIANFTPDKLLNITDDSLFLLGSSWLRFLKAMPQQTLDNLLLTDYLTQLESVLNSYKSESADISSNTNIFLKDDITAEDVLADVEIKFKQRYENQVNDYYKERRYVQIGMIVGIALFTASIIILAMYGFPAIVLASPLLNLGWGFLLTVGLTFSVLPGLALMTTSIDSFTSTLKENHDTLAEALKKEFSAKDPSFFKSASQLTAQINSPQKGIGFF